MNVASFVVVVLLCVVPGASLAWQEDVHYGLTKWLALQAGFTEAQADLLAKSNRAMGENMLDAIEAVCRSACFGKVFEPGATRVGETHFPSRSGARLSKSLMRCSSSLM